MQRTNLLGFYMTTEETDGKGRKTHHNYRMTPQEAMRESWKGHVVTKLKDPQSFPLGDMIDPTTATILRAFAAQK